MLIGCRTPYCISRPQLVQWNFFSILLPYVMNYWGSQAYNLPSGPVQVCPGWGYFIDLATSIGSFVEVCVGRSLWETGLLMTRLQFAEGNMLRWRWQGLGKQLHMGGLYHHSHSIASLLYHSWGPRKPRGIINTGLCHHSDWSITNLCYHSWGPRKLRCIYCIINTGLCHHSDWSITNLCYHSWGPRKLRGIINTGLSSLRLKYQLICVIIPGVLESCKLSYPQVCGLCLHWARSITHLCYHPWETTKLRDIM